MYVLKEHINHLFHETFYEKLKNLSKNLITFSSFHKRFFKREILHPQYFHNTFTTNHRW